MKTTKKDFELFKAECEKWQKYFGLLDWELYFEHKNTGGRAQCCYDINSMIATVTLSSVWQCDIDDYNVRKSAFHEVCELLLCKITHHSILNENITEMHTHEIIKRLENSLFKDLN